MLQVLEDSSETCNTLPEKKSYVKSGMHSMLQSGVNRGM